MNFQCEKFQCDNWKVLYCACFVTAVRPLHFWDISVISCFGRQIIQTSLTKGHCWWRTVRQKTANEITKTYSTLPMFSLWIHTLVLRYRFRWNYSGSRVVWAIEIYVTFVACLVHTKFNTWKLQSFLHFTVKMFYSSVRLSPTHGIQLDIIIDLRREKRISLIKKQRYMNCALKTKSCIGSA